MPFRIGLDPGRSIILSDLIKTISNSLDEHEFHNGRNWTNRRIIESFILLKRIESELWVYFR